MAQVLQAYEKDIRDISRLAVKVTGLLATLDSVPEPVRYQKVIHRVAELDRKWAEHLRLHSTAVPLILSNDSHFSGFMIALERDGLDLASQLKALSSASWPRSPHAGVASIRLRVTATLQSLLRQVEKERTTILPLLRRWTSSQSVNRQSASEPRFFSERLRKPTKTCTC